MFNLCSNSIFTVELELIGKILGHLIKGKLASGVASGVGIAISTSETRRRLLDLLGLNSCFSLHPISLFQIENNEL